MNGEWWYDLTDNDMGKTYSRLAALCSPLDFNTRFTKIRKSERYLLHMKGIKDTSPGPQFSKVTKH